MNLILENFLPKVTYFKNGIIENNVLNNFTIYVINLNEDVYRRAYITHLFKKERINYNLVQVNRITKRDIELANCTVRKWSILGCATSHLWCIKHAIDANCSRFIIFEDDIIFHKDYQNKLADCLHLPFDLLMLGACDFTLKDNLLLMEDKKATHKDSHTQLYTDKVYYPSKNALGGHANVYSLDFAKEFYEYKVSTPVFKEFDTEYVNFYDKWKMAICYPNIVITELTTTNNFHIFSPFDTACYARYISNCFPEEFTLLDYNYMTIDFIKFVADGRRYHIHISTTYSELIKQYLLSKRSVKCYLSNLEELFNSNLYTTQDIKCIQQCIRNNTLVLKVT